MCQVGLKIDPLFGFNSASLSVFGETYRRSDFSRLGFFRNPMTHMNSKLKQGRVTMDEILLHADKNQNSRTSEVLEILRSNKM